MRLPDLHGVLVTLDLSDPQPIHSSSPIFDDIREKRLPWIQTQSGEVCLSRSIETFATHNSSFPRAEHEMWLLSVNYLSVRDF